VASGKMGASRPAAASLRRIGIRSANDPVAAAILAAEGGTKRRGHQAPNY